MKPAGLRAGLLGLTLLGLTASESAAQLNPVIWDLRGISGPELYSQGFEITQSATVHLRVVGAGLEGETELLSYGWLLDGETREPIWLQTIENTEPLGRDDNRVFDGTLDLPAGRYIAHFSALGRRYAKSKEIRIPGLGRIGEIRTAKTLFYSKWDDLGSPRRWRYTIEVVSPDFEEDNILPYDGSFKPDAFIRLAPLSDNSYEKTAFRVKRPVRMEIAGMAEHGLIGPEYADHSWIEEAGSRRLVWKIDPDKSKPAGGDDKNHEFRETVELDTGDYIVTAVTDDSHAVNFWNSAPPLDPERWGVMITPIRESDRGAVEIIKDPREARVIARIDRVPDRAFVRKAFELSRPTAVVIHGVGEFASWNGNCFWDWGWLEKMPAKEMIWSMEDAGEGGHAGGHPKNRTADFETVLPAGTYMLSYVTDDTHAYGRWNAPPPLNPAAWGICVSASETDIDPSSVTSLEVKDADPAIISLAPTGDDVHRKQTFKLNKPVRLRLLAIGEGIRGHMYDYGWIEDEETGHTIWKMNFDKTRHAGGGEKNRIVDTIISLSPGRYRVHFKTDNSHSFEYWNEVRPDHPELWGFTIYRAD